jgi:hypothetical protein
MGVSDIYVSGGVGRMGCELCAPDTRPSCAKTHQCLRSSMHQTRTNHKKALRFLCEHKIRRIDIPHGMKAYYEVRP